MISADDDDFVARLCEETDLYCSHPSERKLKGESHASEISGDFCDLGDGSVAINDGSRIHRTRSAEGSGFFWWTGSRKIHLVPTPASFHEAGGDPEPPRGVRLVGRTLALRRFIGYMVAIGPLPEHAPQYARRTG